MFQTNFILFLKHLTDILKSQLAIAFSPIGGIDRFCQRRGGCIQIQAAPVSAGTVSAVDVYGSMSDLAGDSKRAGINLVIHNDAGSDPRAYADIDKNLMLVGIFQAPHMRECAGVGIMFQKNRKIQFFFQIFLYIDACPFFPADQKGDPVFGRDERTRESDAQREKTVKGGK